MGDLFIDVSRSSVESLFLDDVFLEGCGIRHLDHGKMVTDLAIARSLLGRANADILLESVRARLAAANPEEPTEPPDDDPDASATRTNEIELESKFDEAAPATAPPKTVDHAKPFSTEDADRLRNLPALEELRKSNRWVLWRWEAKPEGGFTKVPFRSDRPDLNARSNDPQTWGSFDAAIDAAIRAEVAGVGIVITSSPLAAFDLDHCRNPETSEIAPSAHPLLNACKGTYIEITPSLDGLRIIGQSRKKEKVRYPKIPQDDGGVLETFRMATRFVTVTGYQIGDFSQLLLLDVPIDFYQAEEANNHQPRQPRTDADGTTIIDIERLRTAMTWIPNHERDVWLHVGMALHTIGERTMWDEWSSDCDKFNMAGQDKAWRHFNDDHDDRINVNSIFYWAKEKGWDRNEIDTDGACVEPVPLPLQEIAALSREIIMGNFRFYTEQGGGYFFVPQGALWSTVAVNAALPWIPVLDRNGNPVLIARGPNAGEPKMLSPSSQIARHQPVQSLTWAPGFPQIIENKRFKEGGWIPSADCTVLNMYQPPIININHADVLRVGLYVDHWGWMYPDDADHLLAWLAFKRQHPDTKINHGLLLGGLPGIGKDTALAPIREAVGPWNFRDVSPKTVLEKWTYFRKAIIVRISEARDLGDANRFQLYEDLKTLMAAPPEVLEVNEKYLKQYFVLNVANVILTTNYRNDAVYLPADDRRHYVAWSNIPENGLSIEKRNALWSYYKQGGFADITAYLQQYDLSKFDPYAAPRKTDAFWSIVDTHRPREAVAIADLLELIGNPNAITTEQLKEVAGISDAKLCMWLDDPKNGRAISYRLDDCGYIPERNPKDKGGTWRIQGHRRTVYVKKDLEGSRIDAVQTFMSEPNDIQIARYRNIAAQTMVTAAAVKEITFDDEIPRWEPAVPTTGNLDVLRPNTKH